MYQVPERSQYERMLGLAKLEALHSIIYTMKKENHQNIPYLNMLRGELLLLKYKLQDHQINSKRKRESGVLTPMEFKKEDKQTTINTLYNNVDQLMDENFYFSYRRANKCKI